tara:strand:- start:173 stop:1165 length:993 start_codon:yes stop_codon:yes gene_type:complete
MRFLDMPKVELHTHIDCSLSHETVARLGVDLTPEEYRQNFVAPERCKDLTEYLACIDPALKILQTKKSLEFAIDGLIAAQAAENVLYAELRFAPHLHLERGLGLDDVMETVLQAIRISGSRYNVECGLILCTLRHFTEQQSLEVADLTLRFADQGVVALDLAGDEANYSIAPNIAAFKQVREAGGNVIAHAGEASGADSVLETLDLLQAKRIGHGVRSVEDMALVERIVAEGLHLEICPSCNIQTGIFSEITRHSLPKLLDSGVNISLNTDGRATNGASLSSEYQVVSDAFGWSDHIFLDLNRNALNASFASDRVKSSVNSQIDDYEAQL